MISKVLSGSPIPIVSVDSSVWGMEEEAKDSGICSVPTGQPQGVSGSHVTQNGVCGTLRTG